MKQEVIQLPRPAVVPHPDNPRLTLDVEDLAKDIKVRGICDPLRVMPPVDGKYPLVAGHRRLKAAEECGLEFVPAIIGKELTPAEFIVDALRDAESAKPLNEIEKAESYQKLMQLRSFTLTQLAKALDASLSAVCRTLTTKSSLNPLLHPFVISGQMKGRYAYRLSTVRDMARQLELGKALAEGKLTGPELEAILDEENRERKGKKPVRLPLEVNLSAGWDAVIGVFEEVVQKLNRLKKAGAKTDAVRGLFK